MGVEAKLLLVGCGKMGGALLRRVCAQKLAAKICIVEPAKPPPDLNLPSQAVWLAAPDKIEQGFAPDIVILAIKPQSFSETVPSYARFKHCVFLSIAAGLPLARIEALLAPGAAVIRAMPNLPASIGLGITVAIANKNVSTAQRALGETFLKAVGETAWVEDEKLLDAVTALSGSGPAYIFALCEAMAQAGEHLGLPAELSARLARATVVGSGALLGQSNESAKALREAVTSPKGTTEAALIPLLAAGGLPDLMLKAMCAAADRARELAQSAGK